MNDNDKNLIELPEAIVVDIDTALAIGYDRVPGGNYEHGDGEPLSYYVTDSILDAMYQHGFRVVLLSAGSLGNLEATKKWLDAKRVSYDEVYCGKERDHTFTIGQLYDDFIVGRYSTRFMITGDLDTWYEFTDDGVHTLLAGIPDVKP